MLSILIRRSPKQLTTSVSLIQRRTLFNYLLQRSEKQNKKRDNIDQSYAMIYKAPMEYYLAFCNYSTMLGAFAFGCFIVDRIINRDKELSTEMKQLEFYREPVQVTETEYVYFAIGMVVIVSMIKLALHRYPLRIYRNHHSYTAVFEGLLPFTRDKMNFVKGEVKELPATGIMPWSEHRFAIKERSTIMYFEYFKTPAELLNMQQAPKKPEVKKSFKKV